MFPADAVANPAEPVLFLRTRQYKRRKRRHSPAREAVESDRSYCVVVKDAIQVVDFDTMSKLPYDGLTRAQRFASALYEAELSPVLIASGGERRAHVWAAVPPHKRGLFAALANLHEGDHRKGPGGMIRPPFAPHRQGLPQRLLDPGTVELALKRLATPDPPPDLDHLRAEDGTLQAKLNEQPSGNRSGGLIALAGYYKRQGYSCEAYCADVIAHPQSAGHKLFFTKGGRPHHRRDAETYLRRTYDRASATISTCQRAELHAQIEEIRAAALAFNWPNKRVKLLPTIYAVLEIAEHRAYRLSFSASCRDVAEAPCISWRTAARHLRALRKLGWLVITRSARGAESAEYRLVYPPNDPPK